MTGDKNGYPTDENGLIILPDGKRFDPKTYVGRPGYLNVNDELMVIRKMGDVPERFDEKTKKWVPFRNRAEATHSNRLTDDEGRDLARRNNIPLDEL